jgi:magnesium-transporting ATPase (P-type)
MSVVCRAPDGKRAQSYYSTLGSIKLYCKGADSMILARVDSRQNIKSTKEHLHMFAAEGLRTLCCSYREISHSTYKEWNKKYHEASIALDDRQGKLDEVAEEIEQNMTLLGATAIEDKLQDGVPETIASLRLVFKLILKYSYLFSLVSIYGFLLEIRRKQQSISDFLVNC